MRQSEKLFGAAFSNQQLCSLVVTANSSVAVFLYLTANSSVAVFLYLTANSSVAVFLPKK